MGVEIAVVAVDLRAYRERILPACHAAEAGEDFAHFVALLREAERFAPRRRYEPPYRSVWDDPEMERRRARAEAARDAGDPGPWKELSADVAEYHRGPPAPAITRGEIAEAIATLESGSAAKRDQARVSARVAPSIVEAVCLPWGRVRSPWLHIGGTELADQLRRASDELDLMLTGIGLTGGTLDVFPVPSAVVMSRADVERFARELAKIPRAIGPDAPARHDAILRELVGFVVANPDYCLVVASD